MLLFDILPSGESLLPFYKINKQYKYLKNLPEYALSIKSAHSSIKLQLK